MSLHICKIVASPTVGTVKSNWGRKSFNSHLTQWGPRHGPRLLRRLEKKTRPKKGFQFFKALRMESHSKVEETQESWFYGPELQGFAQRVAACNEGKERKVEFLPFKVGKEILGYVHYRFAEHLRKFPDVFLFDGEKVESGDAGSINLHCRLSSPQERTAAVQGVLEALKGAGLIPGWRNELLPVKVRYDAPPVLLMERAGVPFFGVKAYGVHVNGYTNIGGQIFLWIGKRSESKETFPGMLDHIAAGAQPEDISAKDNVVKECEEEASIPSHLAEQAVAVGAISCETAIGETYKRDVMFCYDLELPTDFQPHNTDGEVQSFQRLPLSEVFDIINKTDLYKPNCALVIIDFLIRHGYITPEQKGYLSLIRSLRIGEL